MEFILSTDVELADVQNTISALEEKLEFWKSNYPYATYEISRMKDALEILNDLENDVANIV